MFLYITVYCLDDTVAENCILSVGILKVLILLSPAVLTIKDANRNFFFFLPKQVFIAVNIQLYDMHR